MLLDECAPRLLELGPRMLSMNVNDSDADVPAPVPTPEGEQPLAAEVCIWLDCLDRRQPFEEVLQRAGCLMAGYLATESLYTDYGGNEHAKPRDWPDGKRSPGVLTVNLLQKLERLTYEEWLDHWYGTMSPVSEEIQPVDEQMDDFFDAVMAETGDDQIFVLSHSYGSLLMKN